MIKIFELCCMLILFIMDFLGCIGSILFMIGVLGNEKS